MNIGDLLDNLLEKVDDCESCPFENNCVSFERRSNGICFCDVIEEMRHIVIENQDLTGGKVNMTHRFVGIYNKATLEEVVDYAWENKTDIVIYGPGDKYELGYITSGDNLEQYGSLIEEADFYINIKSFNSFEDLCETIATTVIGG